MRFTIDTPNGSAGSASLPGHQPHPPVADPEIYVHASSGQRLFRLRDPGISTRFLPGGVPMALFTEKMSYGRDPAH